MLHTGSLVDSVGLSAVLGHVGVDEIDQIKSDGGAENEWVSDLGADVPSLVVEDADNWSCCAHF